MTTTTLPESRNKSFFNAHQFNQTSQTNWVISTRPSTSHVDLKIKSRNDLTGSRHARLLSADTNLKNWKSSAPGNYNTRNTNTQTKTTMQAFSSVGVGVGAFARVASSKGQSTIVKPSIVNLKAKLN